MSTIEEISRTVAAMVEPRQGFVLVTVDWDEEGNYKSQIASNLPEIIACALMKASAKSGEAFLGDIPDLSVQYVENIRTIPKDQA